MCVFNPCLTCLGQELMSINGLSETAYWLGNLLGAFFEMFLVIIPLIIIFRYDPWTGASGLWVNSDNSVLIVFFTVYAAAASCFSIIIAIVSPRREWPEFPMINCSAKFSCTVSIGSWFLGSNS